MAGSGISRRVLFERAGLAGAGLVLAQLPGFLAGKGWLEDAYAQSADVVRETLDALVAFVVPGPVAKVEFKYRNRTKRTMDNRDFLVGRGVELLEKAGAKEIYRINWPPLILHVQSTMRTGLDPTNSVLDTNCEARAVKRLFVADNSALPNALGGPTRR